MKILNLYSCLGGNRYKWDEVAEEAGIQIEVTAVELDEELARLYQERFPNDNVIVTDAHQFLLDHYKDFDFIWSSPPCPSHSRARFWGHGRNGKSPIFPDLSLYEEIIFLKHHFDGKYVVENVIPYYEPLINGIEIDRHLYWTNFIINTNIETRKAGVCQGNDEVNRLSEFHDYDFRKYKGSQPLAKIARNLVDYEIGKTILETALGIIKKQDEKQISIFDYL